ncbi:MAG: abortive infection family protein [Nitrososphaerota archaeon]|nr:abortive infection family protein [Nitrososphaerota archaeon]
MLAESAGELRNLRGTGHGKDARTPKPEPIYATLAVNAAATISLFLVQIYERNKH